MTKHRSLLVLTPARKDNRALGEYQQTLFDRVLAHFETTAGRWEKVDIVGTENPRAIMAEYPNHDVLLVGPRHAETIRDISRLSLAKLKGPLLYGIPVQDGNRRVIATPALRDYGQGESAGDKAASLLGHLYRHIEQLRIGQLGWENPEEPAHYRLVRNMRDWRRLRLRLETRRLVAIDTETTSLQRIGNTILTLQFGFDGKTGWVLPIAHPESPFSGSELREIKDFLRNYFERAAPVTHIYANAVFDLHQLHDLLELRWYNHKVIDVLAAQFNLDESLKNRSILGFGKKGLWSLERLCYEFGMDHYEQTKLGKGDRSRLVEKPLEDVAEYGGVDVVLPIRLFQMQRAVAKFRNETMPNRPYERFEKHLIEVEGVKLLQFTAMERNGLCVDTDYILSLSGTSSTFLQEIRESEKRFYALPEVREANERLLSRRNVRAGSLFGGKQAAWVFDAGKPEHQTILFKDILKLKPINYGKNDRPKWDKYFKKNNADNKVVAAFADLAEAKTLHSTFIAGFYKLLRNEPDNRDGRLHTSFVSLDIVTGRSSSTKPNLQNLPNRKKRAKIIKRQIIASLGNLIIKRDFSAHEVRVFGVSANDPGLAETFWRGMQTRLKYAAQKIIPKEKIDYWKTQLKAADVHRQNYSIFYGIKPTEVTDNQRSGVKGITFGAIYGMSLRTIGRIMMDPVKARIKEIDVELKKLKDKIKQLKGHRLEN